MRITLNGDVEDIQPQTVSVRDILRSKGWSFPLITVSVNGVTVSRGDWDEFFVREGDRVDAIHLMSGG